MKNELKGSWRRRLADRIIHKLGGYTEQQVILSSNHTPTIYDTNYCAASAYGSIEISEDLIAQNYGDPEFMRHIYREAMDKITHQISVYLRDNQLIHFTVRDMLPEGRKVVSGEVLVQHPRGIRERRL